MITKAQILSRCKAIDVKITKPGFPVWLARFLSEHDVYLTKTDIVRLQEKYTQEQPSLFTQVEG
jgi:hypothetical protein